MIFIYRGYEHGKTHHFESKHDHFMDTALALELCLSGAWLCTLFWAMVLGLMIYLRMRAKQLQKRELAESVEDARIFASSNRIVDGGFPQQHPNLNTVHNSMQMNTLDSKASHQHYATGSIVSAPAGLASQAAAAPPPVSPMQQQMVTQQQMLEQQMQQMQMLQQQNLIRQQSQLQMAAAATQPTAAQPQLQATAAAGQLFTGKL